jgi:nucleotide-binding universal stress UspA family protein
MQLIHGINILNIKLLKLNFMKKILVTTDLSSNSKSGMRFAIQLASQHDYELTFFHSYYVMKPTSWSDASFYHLEKKTMDSIEKKLSTLVDSVYKSMRKRAKNKKCVISSAVLADSDIMDFATSNKFDFICMSTRGAGKIKKIFGTNTSNLIKHSPIPVIAVPQTYRTKKISNILYASDLKNLDEELKQVVEFAKPLKANVELLHFNYPLETDTKSTIANQAVGKFSKSNIKLQLKNINLSESLIKNIEHVVKKTKPSMMIMFTQQNKSFFERLFLSSKSAEYTFKLNVPLLVYNKS